MLDKLFRKKSLESLQKESEESSLKRSLGVFDLTMLGIGAIIGTGIFVLTGEAAAGTEHALGAGPALTLSFVITGLACLFAALCYAEFASMIPVSGSAYTYSYHSFGELIAWIIGWDLILEYAVGNVAVAIGWSGYFKNLLDGFGWYLPGWMSASTGTQMVQLPSGSWTALTPALEVKYADVITTFPTSTALLNMPAVVITLLVTVLLYIGIKESARVNATLVIIKLILVGIFLWFGLPHFNPDVYWEPFAPNGWKGIMTGAALVFFAYVGFDAVSTTSEEAKNPQRDLPRAMIFALVACTILYIVVAGALTGMAPLDVLANEKPVAEALISVGENNIALLIAIGITITMPSVLLVMQLGQIRILFAMSRDGLLGHRFSNVDKRFFTPSFATVAVGLFVAVLAGTIDIGVAAELTNIGTLFAFVLVAIGIWVLRIKQPDSPRKFKTPAFKLVCSLCVLICLGLMLALPYVTWVRFVMWMVIGVVVYFAFGYRHSRLNRKF
ncbi:amino acid permease [uncultured Maribacter sp.]|uniref:amino acid permease n=1 Tax=uncultured Maribacter sp. TaxID=431308 RepID=UPI0030D76C93|tara:strand:- start:981 stop:2480 length:1500 start_codon:yes stop_codon:yes gene_type:complete